MVCNEVYRCHERRYIMTYKNNIIVTNMKDLVKIFNRKVEQGYNPSLRMLKGVYNEDVVSIDWIEDTDEEE